MNMRPYMIWLSKHGFKNSLNILCGFSSLTLHCTIYFLLSSKWIIVRQYSYYEMIHCTSKMDFNLQKVIKLLGLNTSLRGSCQLCVVWTVAHHNECFYCAFVVAAAAVVLLPSLLEFVYYFIATEKRWLWISLSTQTTILSFTSSP